MGCDAKKAVCESYIDTWLPTPDSPVEVKVRIYCDAVPGTKHKHFHGLKQSVTILPYETCPTCKEGRVREVRHNERIVIEWYP